MALLTQLPPHEFTIFLSTPPLLYQIVQLVDTIQFPFTFVKTALTQVNAIIHQVLRCRVERDREPNQ